MQDYISTIHGLQTTHAGVIDVGAGLGMQVAQYVPVLLDALNKRVAQLNRRRLMLFQ